MDIAATSSSTAQQAPTVSELKTKITGDALVKLKKDVHQFNAPRGKSDDLNSKVSQEQFLRLLTMQMSKQDPLDPMKSHESMAQMAQFSALEQMRNVHQSVEKLNDMMAKSQGQTMLGKEVMYMTDADAAPKRGVVSQLLFDETGKTFFSIDGKIVKGNEIQAMMGEAPSAPAVPPAAVRYESYK
jgi:flagellar basal-body rod modification protein FlgD